jgi:hypothetical protein
VLWRGANKVGAVFLDQPTTADELHRATPLREPERTP